MIVMEGDSMHDLICGKGEPTFNIMAEEEAADEVEEPEEDEDQEKESSEDEEEKEEEEEESGEEEDDQSTEEEDEDEEEEEEEKPEHTMAAEGDGREQSVCGQAADARLNKLDKLEEMCRAMMKMNEEILMQTQKDVG